MEGRCLHSYINLRIIASCYDAYIRTTEPIKGGIWLWWTHRYQCNQLTPGEGSCLGSFSNRPIDEKVAFMQIE